MSFDHEAVYAAYPTICTLDDSFGNYGLDKDGNKVSIDPSQVDAARVQLDADYAKVKYKDDRKPLYPPLQDLADALYWKNKGDETKLNEYYAACEKVKTDNPKPS